jgi:hypothetical protein
VGVPEALFPFALAGGLLRSRAGALLLYVMTEFCVASWVYAKLFGATQRYRV